MALFCCGGREMRFSAAVLTLAGAMAMTGCSSLVSLDPFIAEQDAVFDKALTGVWQNAKGDDTYIVRQDGTGYAILFVGDGSPTRLHGRLARIGDAELLDLTAADEAPFQLAVHHLARVWRDGNTLRWAFLDSTWMKEQASRELAARPEGDSILVTAPHEDVRAFVRKAAADERAFQSPEP